MTDFRNKTILITGGAAGIGKLMARKLLTLGAEKMILWDINKENLDATSRALKNSGFDIFSYIVDVSEPEQVKYSAQIVKNQGVRSDIIPVFRPETAVNKIVHGIKNDKLFVRMPGIINFLPLVKGILPVRWFDRIVGKGLGVYKAMNTFRGHDK